VPVSSPVRVADLRGRGQQADVRQAAYYRRLLDQQRTLVEVELADDQAKLAERLRSGDLYLISRLKRVVQAKADEKATLDCLIEVIDERFADFWTG
jgi:hypothetical protein